MNFPSLYQTVNGLQRQGAKDILSEYSNIIQWRGNDLLMDIGCGSGDVTNDFVKPLLPKNFNALIGTDISKEMIRFARNHYENHNVKFEVMDIAGDLNEKYRNKFDHVTSFYCLQWVHNKKKSLQNISDMLSSNGDCLLVLPVTCPIYVIYQSLSKIPKYQVYMENVEIFIGSLHYSQNPIDEYSELMKSVGFGDCHVEVREKEYVFDGKESLKRFIKSVNPFTSRMPIELEEDFLNDTVQCLIDMDLGEKIIGIDDYRCIHPYKLLLAYAKK